MFATILVAEWVIVLLARIAVPERRKFRSWPRGLGTGIKEFGARESLIQNATDKPQP